MTISLSLLENARQRLDSDYFPGAAEDTINQLRQEEDGSKLQKKGKTKKTYHNKAIKAAGQTDLSANASKAVLLVQQLGETTSPIKEDFTMVHLQHSCNRCSYLMVSGNHCVETIAKRNVSFATKVLTMASLYFPNGFQY
ncbi:hypothetical protein MKW92_046263, partial [Papaver armeniacum]